MKKLFSIFSVALFALVLLCMNTVDAAAEEPTTYYVQYDSKAEQWYYQVGSSWDYDVAPPKREIYYMLQTFKDGDYVVVESTDGGWPELELDFHLGNLTIIPYSSCMVKAKSVAECYVLHDSYVSITADVEKAWVYDNVTCNFNKNCNTLELIYESEPTMAVGVVGTCNDFCASSATEIGYHLWSFTDQLIFNEGVLKTSAESYSINPPAAPAAPVVPTTPTTTTPTTSTPTSSADEYDDVPKTGESVAYLWLFALAGLCFAGSYSLKNKRF